MSYDAQEISVKDGRPFFLYQFSTPSGSTYLTSDPEELVKDSQTWVPESISHDKIEINGNVEKNELNLFFPLSSEFALDLLAPQTSVMTLTIFRGHHGDLSEELRAVWKGRVAGARSGKQSIRVVSESIYTSLRRTGCTARVQRTCRHALYLPGCNLDKAVFAINATLSAISGLTLTVAEAASYPDGRFKAGMIDYNGNWGFIQSHVGTSLTLVSEIVNLEDVTLPVSVVIYPGCDRSMTVCSQIFGNLLNNGSFPYRPSKNPFSGSLL